jgi:hypothetical protein
MYHLLERLAFVEAFQLPTQLAEVHPARLRQLAQRGQRYRPQAFANLANPREREALLVAHLHELQQALIGLQRERTAQSSRLAPTSLARW